MAKRAFASFSLNDGVRVRLTPAGIAECECQTRELNEVIIADGGEPFPIGPYTDSDGYHRTTIYWLMNRFGHMMWAGGPSPFVDTRIEIELPPVP